MLFNEKEMRELCKRYDIEIINSDDKDYYKDLEFSMKSIMNEPYVHTVVEKCIASESIEIPIAMENDFYFDNGKDCTCQVVKENYYDDLKTYLEIVSNRYSTYKKAS